MRITRGSRRRVIEVAVAAALLLALPPSVVARSAGTNIPSELPTDAGPSFFASVETRSSDFGPLSKWRGVLARHGEDHSRDADCPALTMATPCLDRQWSTLVSALRPLAPAAQMALVTQTLNAKAYVTDRTNFGMSDYWQTPAEFMARGGDCEDFAIAKYLALREAGWAAEQLRVVVVIDERRSIAHAVLIASHEGKAWVLDNLTNEVIEATAVRHYRPLFSLSETAWWRHRPAADQTTSDTGPTGR